MIIEQDIDLATPARQYSLIGRHDTAPLRGKACVYLDDNGGEDAPIEYLVTVIVVGAGETSRIGPALMDAARALQAELVRTIKERLSAAGWALHSSPEPDPERSPHRWRRFARALPPWALSWHLVSIPAVVVYKYAVLASDAAQARERLGQGDATVALGFTERLIDEQSVLAWPGGLSTLERLPAAAITHHLGDTDQVESLARWKQQQEEDPGE